MYMKSPHKHGSVWILIPFLLDSHITTSLSLMHIFVTGLISRLRHCVSRNIQNSSRKKILNPGTLKNDSCIKIMFTLFKNVRSII